MVKASPFIHQPDQVVQKVSDVLAADWWYHAYMKKYDIFSCIVMAFLRAQNPCITPQFMWWNEVTEIFVIFLGSNRGQRLQFKQTFEFDRPYSEI